MEQSEKMSMPQSRKEKDYRYAHSLKGYIRRKRYNDSERGRTCRDRCYARYGGQLAYSRERCDRIQDEVGCHSDIRTFYLGFCLIQALATAEVVEI